MMEMFAMEQRNLAESLKDIANTFLDRWIQRHIAALNEFANTEECDNQSEVEPE